MEPHDTVVSGSTGPLIPRRRIGAELRRLREARGEQLKDTAQKLMFSASKLSRIETGQAEPLPRDLRDLLNYFEISDAPEGDRLRQWAADAARPGWWQQLGFPMPRRLDTLIAYESSATAIEGNETIVTPGLLQTRAYTRAILERLAPHLTAEELENQVELRSLRQRHIFAKAEPPSLLFALPETALLRQVGSAEVMRDQLGMLLDSLDRPEVTLHIIPFSAGLYRAMEGGFTVFHFSDSDLPDVVNTESVLTSQFVTDDELVTRHRQLFADMQGRWLDEKASRALIAERRDQFF